MREHDAEWWAWIELQRKVAALIMQRDRRSALSLLDSFIAHESNPEFIGEALGLRASLKTDLGQLHEAKEDLLKGRALSSPLSYSRYVHELCLGGVCEKLHLVDEALSWYRNALTTSSQAEGIAAGAALDSFLRICGEKPLSQRDRDLCMRAIHQSWRVLRLPGEPDMADWAKAIAAICEAQRRPVRPVDEQSERD